VAVQAGSVVRRNVIANVVGGGWIVLLNLISIPVQIRLLGAESYGLIGFVISLQAFLMILDFGLSTTVVREIAGDSSADHQESRHLIQTSASIYWLVASLIAIGLILSAPWLANQWLNLEELPTARAVEAFRILGIWLLFTWPFVLYTSILTGLQRLDIANVLRVISQSVAQGGAILLLLISKDLILFSWWLAGSAAVSTIVAILITKRLVPSLSLGPRISKSVILQIWRFSLDVNLISILAIVFTQLDKLFIGRLLPMRMLGHYNAAYNISRGVAVIQGFINTAVLPALASDHRAGDFTILRGHYYRYAQSLVYTVTLPSLILIFFADPILELWVSADTARAASTALILLGVGFWLNAVMSATYSLAVASGHTRIPLKVNIAIVGIYLPALYFLIRSMGIDGAGVTWLGLNLYYFVTLLPLTQRRIIQSSSIGWLRKNVFPFFSIGLLIFILAKQTFLFLGERNTYAFALLILVTSGIYLFLGYFFLEKRTREQLQEIPVLILKSMRTAILHQK